MRKKSELTYDSVPELARDLNIGILAAYRGLREGRIPAIRSGKRFIIPRAGIVEWLRTAGGKLPTTTNAK